MSHLRLNSPRNFLHLGRLAQVAPVVAHPLRYSNQLLFVSLTKHSRISYLNGSTSSTTTLTPLRASSLTASPPMPPAPKLHQLLPPYRAVRTYPQ